MFHSPDDASRAVSELMEAGFDDAFIHVIAHKASAAELVAQGILPLHAKAYAEDLANGGTLLLVAAPLGSAGIATGILESISPGNSGEPMVHYQGWTWDDSTPISSALRMPTLTKDPTPLSSFFGWPLLSHVGPKERWFGLPLLWKDGFAMPLWFGMPLILKQGKTLSAVFGWPTLIK
jgi:hypothetical protein